MLGVEAGGGVDEVEAGAGVEDKEVDVGESAGGGGVVDEGEGVVAGLGWQRLLLEETVSRLLLATES